MIPRTRIFTLATLSSLLALAEGGAYTPESPFLADPESILPYLEQSTEFWTAAWDADDQAFFSDVGLDGKPTSSNKAFLIQSRNAYAFSKAFAVTGNTDYLPYADGALRYLYDFGWDTVNGGWWGQADSNGNINTGTWYNDSRWSFWQHYMLLGPLAYHEATGDAYHKSWIDAGNEINDLELWDDRPGFEGYFHDAAIDWSWKVRKGFTPTVDAITTSALTNYLMTRDPMRKERLVALGDNILRMVNGDHGHVVSFPSGYSENWVVDASEQNTSIGHHIKTAWCLARVYLMEPDIAYRSAAEELLDQIWYHEDNRGFSPWDHTNGIMRGNINVFSGAVSGTADWWTVEQGFTSGIMNWYVTRRPEFLEMADESFKFFMDHYYDYVHGEVFSVVSASGTVTNSKKGDMFKGGYHSIELFYLLYLYGNLFYKNEPVTLYYNFSPAASLRTIHLWPIAMEDDRLIISEVRRNGMSYSKFDGDGRMLEIPAGQGGIYAVTFESRYNTNPPGQFDQDWWADWFGAYYLDRAVYPWVYHAKMGWSHVVGHAKTSEGWFYDGEGGFWYHVRGDLYPWVYRSDIGWSYLQ